MQGQGPLQGAGTGGRNHNFKMQHWSHWMCIGWTVTLARWEAWATLISQWDCHSIINHVPDYHPSDHHRYPDTGGLQIPQLYIVCKVHPEFITYISSDFNLSSVSCPVQSSLFTYTNNITSLTRFYKVSLIFTSLYFLCLLHSKYLSPCTIWLLIDVTSAPDPSIASRSRKLV